MGAGSPRITLGRDTTPEDVDALADDLPDLVAAARRSPASKD